MPPRSPCKFFDQPNRCRFGDRCKFAHNSPGTHTENAAPSSPPQSPRNRGASSVPGGVCRFYWTSGNCRKEFDCTYRHIKQEDKQPRAVQPSQRTLAVESIAAYLTPAGLTKLSGTATDIFAQSNGRELSPNETHGHMTRFLRDEFRFNTSSQKYQFVSLLVNASSVNKAWTMEDGQLLLQSLASGNGFLRLDDIISSPEVTINAGPDPKVLSFQRGYLPLLFYLSSDFVTKSTLKHLVNGLYTLLETNCDHFVDVIRTCMTAIMVAKSFRDVNNPSSQELMGSQVIASLVGVLFEYVTRFKHALAMHQSLPDLVRDVANWFDIYVEAISTSPPGFNDQLAKAPQPAREHLIRHMRTNVERIMSIVDREQGLLERSARRQERKEAKLSIEKEKQCDSMITALWNTYEGPGELREEGPRHDNDFAEIEKIRIAPTDQELVCRIPPFLPANIPDAPHPLKSDSMERLLDIQFRLLREELTAPLRKSVQLVLDDLAASSPSKTQLHALKTKRGGRYNYQGQHDSLTFSLYTDVAFKYMNCDSRRGLVVSLEFNTPPGTARSTNPNARSAFWKGQSGKRLMQGGLVAVVWPHGLRSNVYLGTIASSADDIAESAKRGTGAERLLAKVQFFDPMVELRIMETLRHKERPSDMLLLEATIMFEAVRPFLESLKREPELFPFKHHLVLSKSTEAAAIAPPKYSLIPGFSLQLRSLFDDETEDLQLSTQNEVSIHTVREELRSRSRLDPSQADAVVDTLTREVSLIQGPPGTGKSFTGVEIIRILVENRIGPILMIAFTNHALDHMLCSVLDAKITTKLARLGSRSSDERISKYSIEELEKVANHSRLDGSLRQDYKKLKETEEELKTLMNRFFDQSVSTEQRDEYLRIHYPDHSDGLLLPPKWIDVLYHVQDFGSENDMAWTEVSRNGQPISVERSLYGFWKSGGDLNFLRRPTMRSPTAKSKPVQQRDSNPFALLSAEADQPEPPSSESSESDSDSLFDDDDDDIEIDSLWEILPPTESESDSDSDVEHPPTAGMTSPNDGALTLEANINQVSMDNGFSLLDESDVLDQMGFFTALGLENIPDEPVSDRALDDLLLEYNVWKLSAKERQRLDEHWSAEVKETFFYAQQSRFEVLRDTHLRCRERRQEKESEGLQVRLQILRKLDIIGCTTTGAAKLTNLLKGLSPRVMLVEEAGQVLEAHILGSLVESVEHLILIGDPLQLRPNVNNYELSMDNPRGRKIYRFDMSLMERLSTSSGLPMSRLDVQRRMRPTISSLIRNTLYPKLEDHDCVQIYPPVRGFAKNLFFLDHPNKERGGGDDSVSKHNIFEVQMIRDLVLYLLRQGCYSEEGDIVVLCAYLGQLARVRDALASEVAVVIDERDQVELANMEQGDSDTEGTPTVEKIRVTKRVKIRTVDNYQGEEANIIILSLVRNSGGPGKEAGEFAEASRSGHSIGFLKSLNRTNVALSRAKHGLYILGNAWDLARNRNPNSIWASIIEQLRVEDAIGDAFTIQCSRHPDETRQFSKPGELPRLSPDGGCLRPCDVKLKCGHLCPYKCHSDDEHHIAVRCSQSCVRLCPRGHPCNKECAEDCGKCMHPIRSVQLPCGHTLSSIPCWRSIDLSDVHCREMVTRSLPNCEHTAEMECGGDVALVKCEVVCGGAMSCCTRICASKCGNCQLLNATQDRLNHQSHHCLRDLYCQHRCKGTCAPEHKCSESCKEPCRQVCAHARCRLPCSTPCAPCMEPCTWICIHSSRDCPVPCGSPCARLPCDERCTQQLSCGHQCPSVCGENCSIQICPQCAQPEDKEKVVDLIMHRTLDDITPELGTIDELIITLPACKHFFTVETLDGVCALQEYYRQKADGTWIGLDVPPSGFKKPPTCPTCRSEITSPRYGRVFKRANLDILENNIAARMSQDLGHVRRAMIAIDKEITAAALRVKVSGLRPTKVDEKGAKKRMKKREKILQAEGNLPLTWDKLDPASPELHGIPRNEASGWHEHVRLLKRVYDQAITVANTTSAHGLAWEAAFSTLYRREMDAAAANPARAPRAPEEHAMRIARIDVGQPRPLADSRFCVEAFWETIQIRLILADLAETWYAAANDNANYPTLNKRLWASFIIFIFKSCIKDSEIALGIAERSGSRRQITKTQYFVLLSYFEVSRFNSRVSRESTMTTDVRRQLADKLRERKDRASALIEQVTREHNQWKHDPSEREWLLQNFSNLVQGIVDDWESLERSIRADTFYSSVSREERMQLIKALMESSPHEFRYSGHWYNCPNGHTFTIGDCGGAASVSRCPECNEPIGGHGHNLLSTNTRAIDMEEIVREVGGEQSPYAWGRLN
ncbi:hypothetical protein BD410DRAFT_297523 [Rickenella mellea]|uniref:P-loop containing nucleoside triphosphate hydrolase protein n=1 Tax=Rickenella mellea TaxID=50990 RepID=A0A4Y7Q1S6_9AGAM|nr:hypothetical protein BD410DRAFT_297523 [Rickenella mellea]